MNAAPRVLFHVQHLLGIGHLARASLIAGALRGDGFAVTLALGGPDVPGFPGDGFDIVRLPPVRAGEGGFASLVDENGTPVDDAFKARRRDMLLAAFARIAPDILVTEAYPFGRRQMRFELNPLLEAARARTPRPLIAVSIRDILQVQPKPERLAETLAIIEASYDLVLVHGDPRLVGLEKTFAPAAAIADRIEYTGLVAGKMPPLAGEPADIVVSAGGGAAGRALFLAAAAAADLVRHQDRTWLFLTGTNPDPDVAARLRRVVNPNVRADTLRTDFRAVLSRARLSISQAGYNTVCDILVAGCRALLVPFAAAGETEQTLRAGLMAQRGRAAAMSETALDPAAMAELVDRQLEAAPPPPLGVRLDGAERTAAILRERLAARR